MNFKKLLNIHGLIDWRHLNPDAMATGIFFDSRKVISNSIYIAICGTTNDGHDYLDKAIENGAQALVVENKAKVPAYYSGAVIEVLDTRLSLQVLSKRFYDSPGDQLTSIAVTGTNGKTSSTFIIEYLLHLVSRKCGVIGTIDHHLGSKKWTTDLTTPDPVTLQKRLSEFVDLNADSFVIEVSSHALKQMRIDQSFDICIFTNLSRDHLDYHSDMEDYFLSKAKLFEAGMLKKKGDNFAIINGDDPYGVRLSQMTHGRQVFLFGKNDSNDFVFKIIDQSLEGMNIELKGPNQLQLNFKIPLIGEHNVYNTLGSLISLYVLGYDLKDLSDQLKNFKGIPGRVQSLKSKKDVYAFVDYAHTPEALEKVIVSLKHELKKDKKIITVFGCGGDRDKGKRPLMGQIAVKLSDITCITSDNPRTEKPEQIINDILHNMSPSNKIIVEPDRAKAISHACQIASEGDVILVAGKGHEDYQIIGTSKKHFSDYEEISKNFNS
jgi:UDP-N-acetylmuramoyl-L-alanyl-D-glutamate--2,6-diaminopimelate ligase